VNVAAVIALHRWQHAALVAERPEQLEQQWSASGDVLDRRGIDRAHEPLGTLVSGPQLRI
jgi:hypothetical protein